MQTLTRRGVRDAAAGLGLHFLHMSEGPFSHDAGQLSFYTLYAGILNGGLENIVHNVTFLANF